MSQVASPLRARRFAPFAKPQLAAGLVGLLTLVAAKLTRAALVTNGSFETDANLLFGTYHTFFSEIDVVVAVPEPSSAALLAAAVLVALARRGMNRRFWGSTLIPRSSACGFMERCGTTQ